MKTFGFLGNFIPFVIAHGSTLFFFKYSLHEQQIHSFLSTLIIFSKFFIILGLFSRVLSARNLTLFARVFHFEVFVLCCFNFDSLSILFSGVHFKVVVLSVVLILTICPLFYLVFPALSFVSHIAASHVTFLPLTQKTDLYIVPTLS